MSFIHYTIVGHFDPTALGSEICRPTRPLDIEKAKNLLSEFPEYVASRVEFCDGYVQCCWADFSMPYCEAAYQYAYRLAERLDCIAAESPLWLITFPEDAKQEQLEALKRWQDEHPTPEPRAPAPPMIVVPPPRPCPYCGKLLRTAIARQCRFCKKDWHDPENVYCRATSLTN